MQTEKLELDKLPIPVLVECGKGEKARIVYNAAAQERDKKADEKKKLEKKLSKKGQYTPVYRNFRNVNKRYCIGYFCIFAVSMALERL